MQSVTVTEVAPGVHLLALPLGIQGVETVSAYLLAGGQEGAGSRADTLVDCGVSAAPTEDGDPGPDGTAALEAALTACGSGFERIERLVVTHAHIDHFGLAGEVVRRSGGELWMHRRTELDLAKYAEPDEAVDRRELMLADHGLFGPVLTETSRGLCDWLPVMPSIGRPSTLLDGGERFVVGERTWEVLHTPGHSPGHVCLWSAADRLLCSGDHLLKVASPPVTFERGFERDPMGSYLASLERVRVLDPTLTLPGHGPAFPDGARRAASISRNKLRRLAQIRERVETRERTATELTAELYPSLTTGAQRHFAIAEILADLAYHEVRGVLRRDRRADGVYVWRSQGS
jgi:glyoxylase-like metal-dependent hydrolase (beta-lactamase superfamily II)